MFNLIYIEILTCFLFCIWAGLLCGSTELGVQEVYDWIVNQSYHNFYFHTHDLKSLYSWSLIVFFSYWVLCGSVVLFPVAVTFLITLWFIQFVDGFFSPIYENLGVDIFGKTEKLIKIIPPSLCKNWTSFWILWYCYVLLVKLKNR